MALDSDFAGRLSQALIEAETAHDGKITREEREGSKGVYGLEERSAFLAETNSLQAKRGTGRLSERLPYLSREKLDRLKGSDLRTPLSLQELTLLDLLLQDAGQTGLVGLLRPRTWVDTVVATGNVLFVVGTQIHSYMGREGDFVVAHDLRAVTHLLRDFDRRAALPIDSDILYSSAGLTPGAAPSMERDLSRMLPTSLTPTVFVGSPATNLMTENACAQVLGFKPWAPDSGAVPFWFAWPGQMAINSTLTNPKFAGLQGSNRVFSFNGGEHKVDRDIGRTHGVVVLAQLDRPLVIIMGVTAAATYGCAMVAGATVIREFPPPGEAVLAHVEAESELDPDQSGADKRVVRDARVVAVGTWSARTRTWIQRP